MAAALALGTSLAYGLANYLGPRLARGAPVYLLLIVGQSCALVLALALALAGDEPFPGTRELAFAALAGLGNAGGLILFYRAAELGSLSIITPIGALGTLVPVSVGLANGEHLVMLEAIGIVLAMTGVAFAARRHPQGEEVDQGPDPRRAIVLTLLSAVFFGVFLAAMDPAADGGASWAVWASRVSLVATLVVVGSATGALAGAPLRTYPLLAIPGLLLFTGTILYSIATTKGELSIVSVLGTLFPIVTITLAVALDGERLSKGQAAGVAATIVGAVLISAR